MELTTLSWMLLAADIGGKVGPFFVLFLILSLFFVIVRGVIVTIDSAFEGKDFRCTPLWAIILVLMWVVPAAITSLVPSTTVIMQVAAIELGEDVLNSDEFKRILSAYIPKEN